MAKQNYNDSESLKRSHSTWSNTKLTSLCVLATFAVSVLWVALSALFVEQIPSLVCYIALGVSGVLTLFSLFLFAKFKR